MRDMMSVPKRTWGFVVEALALISPLFRSHR